MRKELKDLTPDKRKKLMDTVDSMTDEQEVEEVLSMLDTDGKGEPLSTPDNYNTIFLNDPLLKGAFSTNLLTDRIDVMKDLGWYRSSDHLTDVDIQYLILYLDQNYHLSSERRINSAVQIAANEYRYHPIQDYLNSLKWDGKERVRYALHHFLGAEVNDYNYEMLRLFMLGAVVRVFEPGTKFDYMLCLVGDQGAGKSTFFRFLAIKDEWFTDDLRKLDDENVFRKIVGHWIIEMSEMIATLNSKSIEESKSFITRQSDTYKVPYETHPKDYKRQCVFAGTSNTMDFLPFDRSGNRRFLPVLCNAGQAEVHILADEKASREYIDQMWAEIMVEFNRGDYSLTPSKEMEDYLRELQQEFMPEDTMAMRILNFLDDYDGDMVCSLQLYYEALGHTSFDEPKQYEIREINSIMNNCAKDWDRFDNPRRFPAPYNRQKGWARQPDPGNTDGFIPVSEEKFEQLGLPEEWWNPENPEDQGPDCRSGSS